MWIVTVTYTMGGSREGNTFLFIMFNMDDANVIEGILGIQQKERVSDRGPISLAVWINFVETWRGVGMIKIDKAMKTDIICAVYSTKNLTKSVSMFPFSQTNRHRITETMQFTLVLILTCGFFFTYTVCVVITVTYLLVNNSASVDPITPNITNRSTEATTLPSYQTTSSDLQTQEPISFTPNINNISEIQFDNVTVFPPSMSNCKQPNNIID